jgi:hypothetical protein
MYIYKQYSLKNNIMDELVTVKTSDFEAALAIAKSYLIDNGIDCVVNGEYITISLPEGGGARLQVMSGDYNRAIELLIKGGFAKREDYDFRE